VVVLCLFGGEQGKRIVLDDADEGALLFIVRLQLRKRTDVLVIASGGNFAIDIYPLAL
jgi:hypothetical protein